MSGRTVTTAMGLKGRGQGMARFLESKSLKPFVSNELAVAINTPVSFVGPRGGPAIMGYEATVLPELCSAVIDAHAEGKLPAQQIVMAEQARMLSRSFGKIGIIALVDEATGFQYDRQKNDLQQLLEKFLVEELRRWVKTFPPEYFKEMCRLRNAAYRPDMKLPQYFGHLTNDVVYDRLAPYVLEEMKERTEKDESGRRKARYHQWLTPDHGHPKLLHHLGIAVGLMKISDTWDEFVKYLEKAAPSFTKDPLWASARARAEAGD